MSETETCRVCGSALGDPALDLAAPALTTANLRLDAPTRVHVCETCAHLQSPEPPDLAAYYDTHYKISLESEEHDQLYEMREGVPVYRTDRQAEVVLQKADPGQGARVLDYGAAKAQTLQKILARRPDLAPHVFDVSDDYRPFWSAWLAADAVASYAVPEAWLGRFDLVTSHYVLEHVADPVVALRGLASLLAPGGRLFFSVPDWSQNTGDLLVADHINHFTAASIRRLAREAGLVVDDLDAGALPSAFAVTCHVGDPPPPTPKSAIDETVAHARAIVGALTKACARLDRDFEANLGRATAVYGAGFYGAFLLTRMAGRIAPACCLDNNRHLWGNTLFDVPVAAPDALPADVDVVYVGLNPAHAREIAAAIPVLQRPGLDLVFIEV
ncbi:MAG TPA: methyltransferase domain-containing protein [Caulobacteraceae bacterium]|jgi:SAM-dependent methyltransferase|nr:methyltransferase domain-containing protein [Caulobacteraceae bacterium]